MTGQERADLAIAIELIHNLDQSMQAGFLAVRSEQANQFSILDTRLKSVETGLSNEKAVDADRKAVDAEKQVVAERNRITKRWVISAVIAIMGAGGGIVAVATAILSALQH